MDPRVSNVCAEAQLSQLSVQCARRSVSDAHTRSLIQTDGDALEPSSLTAREALQVRLSNALNWRHAGSLHSIVSISAFSVYENIILFKSSQPRSAVHSPFICLMLFCLLRCDSLQHVWHLVKSH